MITWVQDIVGVLSRGPPAPARSFDPIFAYITKVAMSGRSAPHPDFLWPLHSFAILGQTFNIFFVKKDLHDINGQ